MCPAVPMMSGMLGGCPGSHGGCGERSGGARRQPRCQMAARSSLLRRPTPGARPARRTSSVVAALAALAPRLVRLAHHDYPDRLLGSRAGARRLRRGRGGRTGSGRALGLLGVVLLHVVGCGAKLAISGPAPRAAPLVWSANEVVCVVQPADGRAGDTVYYGSGAAVAKRIADVIRAHRQVKVIPVGDRSDEPRACAARHGRYAVVPVVLRWERHSGALFSTESVKLELSLPRSDNREAAGCVRFELRNSQRHA